MILFVAFGVIFVTLVGLGSGAAGGALARRRHVGDDEHRGEREAEIVARREALTRRWPRSRPWPTTANCRRSGQAAERRHEIRANQLPDSSIQSLTMSLSLAAN